MAHFKVGKLPLCNFSNIQLSADLRLESYHCGPFHRWYVIITAHLWLARYHYGPFYGWKPTIVARLWL